MIKSEPDLSIVEMADQDQVGRHLSLDVKMTLATAAGGGEGGGDGAGGPDHLVLRLLVHGGPVLPGARGRQLLDPGGAT